ncbi:MAG: hypothetical protein OXC55_07835 [Chloroflexi bacterium]|nr:hypothetical protein [Chloroflexota bacterium]
MQDRFVGDVGDFGKYGLLRWLCGDRGDGRQLRLGVIWYYVERDEPLPALGQAFNYLSTPGQHERRLIQRAPEGYEILQNLINGGQRSVEAIEDSKVLPDSAIYYRDPVNAPLARDGWLTQGMRAVKDCDVAFLDPDNGLAVTPDVEHATYGEGAEIYGAGKSLVIYQHFSRQGTHEDQITHHAANLRRVLGIHGPLGEIIALHFRRLPPRIYFVIPNPAKEKVSSLLRERTASFMESCWGDHFTQVDC